MRLNDRTRSPISSAALTSTPVANTGATPYAILIQRRFSNPNAQPLRDSLSPY